MLKKEKKRADLIQKFWPVKRYKIKASLAFKIINRNNFICRYCGKDNLGSMVPWRRNSGPLDPCKEKGDPAGSCSLCAVMIDKKISKSIKDVGKDIDKKWKQLKQKHMMYLMKRREQIYKNFFRIYDL